MKDDPIVTGHRDAAADVRVIPEVKPGPDPDEDAPDCTRCADTLATDRPRGTLCRKNGDPSSARHRSALADCVCYDKCITPCAGFCAGSARDAACESCMNASCAVELAACVGDRR